MLGSRPLLLDGFFYKKYLDKGNKKLRHALVEAARSAARTKNTFLSAQYHRIAARRGTNRAAVAVGAYHSNLTIIYYLLVRKQNYVELGSDFYDQRRKDIIKQSVKRLKSLGVKVSIEDFTITKRVALAFINDKIGCWAKPARLFWPCRIHLSPVSVIIAEAVTLTPCNMSVWRSWQTCVFCIRRPRAGCVPIRHTANMCAS